MRRILFTLLSLVYPGLVYLGYSRCSPSALAWLLAGLALLRALTSRDKIWRITAGIALVLALISMAGDQILPLKLYPALVNMALLLVFASSLAYPPTVVERIATLREGQLPPAAIHYTRRVTQVWCGFFVFNGLAALITALWTSNAVWALYNGLIAYLLMGTLFAIEWLIRTRLKSKLAI